MVETTQADRIAAKSIGWVRTTIDDQAAALLEGVRIERAAVVAWLRDIRDDENPPTLFKAAAMIERGEHIAKGE